MEAGKERATSMANAPFAMRQLTVMTRRFGSIAAHSGCPSDVRFPSDRDRIPALRASLAPRFFFGAGV